MWSGLLEEQRSVSQRNQVRGTINFGIRRRATLARKTGDTSSGDDRKVPIGRPLEYFLSTAVGNVEVAVDERDPRRVKRRSKGSARSRTLA
jgi:hypothetical protein